MNTKTEKDPEELRAEADELKEAAQNAEEQADRLERLHDLANTAQAKLKTLEDDEELGDKPRHQFGLLRHMVGMIEHNQQWGYAASYYRQDARRKESEAANLRHMADDMES